MIRIYNIPEDEAANWADLRVRKEVIGTERDFAKKSRAKFFRILLNGDVVWEELRPFTGEPEVYRTLDGYTFKRQKDGTYTDGDMIYGDFAALRKGDED